MWARACVSSRRTSIGVAATGASRAGSTSCGSIMRPGVVVGRWQRAAHPDGDGCCGER